MAQVGSINWGVVSTRMCALHYWEHCLLCYAICDLHKNFVRGTMDCNPGLLDFVSGLLLEWE